MSDQATPPVTGNPQQQQPAQLATIVRWIQAILIVCIIIAGIFVAARYTIVPQVPEVRVDSVTLTDFNISNQSLIITSHWDVRLTVRNPNGKMTLRYDNMQALLFYKSERLADTTVPPFVQGTKKETNVRATFVASTTFQERYVDEINTKRAHGSVNFIVGMASRLSFKVGPWHGRTKYLQVYCGDLQVGISANSAGGSLLRGSKQCRVRI